MSGKNYSCEITQQEEGKHYAYGIDGKIVQEVYIDPKHQEWNFVVPSNSSKTSDIRVGKQTTELKDGGHITVDTVQYDYQSKEGNFKVFQRSSDRLDDKGYMEYEDIKVNKETGDRVAQTYREYKDGKRTFSRKDKDGIVSVCQDSNGTVVNICDENGEVKDTIRYDANGMPIESRKGFSFNERGEVVANPKKTFNGIEQMPENIFESPEAMKAFGGRSTRDGGVPEIDTQGYYEEFKEAYPDLSKAQEILSNSHTRRHSKENDRPNNYEIAD